MNSDIKIFISTHRNDVQFPDSDLLYPIQVGTNDGNRFDVLLHDDEGDNIADKNSSYCELTAQYYVYKNIEADYYGFFHYRRYFNFSKTKYPEIMRPFVYGDVLASRNSQEFLEKYDVCDDAIRETVEQYDFIIPDMIDTPDGCTLYDQYKLSVDHYIHDLDTVLDIIRVDYPEIWPYAIEYCSGTKSYVCNMFIMNKKLFREYSSFLFDVLDKHEQISDFSNYSSVAKRVSGYLGERLCGIYISYLKGKGYKYKELQRVFFEEFRTDEAIEKDLASQKENGQKEQDVNEISKVKSSYFDENYEQWFDEHKATDEILEIQRTKKFDVEPKYSIVVPLYNTPLDFFDDMLGSVLAQTYKNYELILVNASPDNKKLLERATEVEHQYEQVKHIVLEDNYGITENTNYGIKEADGDFICFFDHDDLLEPDVLVEYTAALNGNPEIDMFYCDEDKLCDGKLCYPFFKPDWNIDYLNAVNYVCHFLTIRKSILDTMELPTSIYDGSQDYHMTYRIGEKARSVCHIPKVLYHWRIHANSTAGSALQKDYTFDSSVQSIKEHIERMKINAEVEESELCPRRFSIRYNMPDELVSIIVSYQGDLAALNRLLLSIRRNESNVNYEILLVGQNMNAISFYIDRLIKCGVDIKALECNDINEAYLVGRQHAKGTYYLFVNSDVEFLHADWMQIVGTCSRDDVLACGPRFLASHDIVDNVGIMLNENNIVKNACGMDKTDGASLDRFLCSMDVEALSGKCIAIRKDIYEKIGGFDRELSDFYNGIDFSIKAKRLDEKGNLVVDPTVEVLDNCVYDTTDVSEYDCLKSKWTYLNEIRVSSYNPNLDRFKEYDVIAEA